MYTIYNGDNIRFTVVADINFELFDDMSLYLYNSVKSYKLIKDEEWIVDYENNKISVNVEGYKTKEMITGNYNLVIKAKIVDKEEREFFQSAKCMNIFLLDDSPSKGEFIDKEVEHECNCNCNGQTNR